MKIVLFWQGQHYYFLEYVAENKFLVVYTDIFNNQSRLPLYELDLNTNIPTEPFYCLCDPTAGITYIHHDFLKVLNHLSLTLRYNEPRLDLSLKRYLLDQSR